jgi:hypothetical protein
LQGVFAKKGRKTWCFDGEVVVKLMVECWFLDGGFSALKKCHSFEVKFWSDQFCG